MAKKPQAAPDVRHYDIVLAPHITEKSTMLSESQRGRVQGRVRAPPSRRSRRRSRRCSDVKVTGVNTIVTKGKTKRWKGKPYQRSDMKKAIVTLAEGQSIDITEGVRG